ncbi:hypothetical protein [Bradyrhizobium sp.]|jgi:peptidoglycan biosynthesis protein MviN/MurJ (putative lipid II flippase)|uniref:hypothetical protein n=1 Tax=Bradyrhizobium sp. TaxID=376 RepID=UPI002DDD4874|nr:hypothetical protein [Bradyrhizobium sp.]HEV2156932.1 hypothetical protein [Bradyrhizobium sp.]
MTSFGLLVVTIIGILCAAVLVAPTTRHAYLGQARRMVGILFWLALFVLLVSLWSRIGW